ncbi:PARP10_14_15 [Mytilus coruscus]|uniref:PARP10_14_15 n=1 Tax=Mytilus coruscus TaxID=42192 RepID=A0A6J8D9P2_MYTCO|nr:PARP10_14_15 [Mytilus coruscus]
MHHASREKKMYADDISTNKVPISDCVMVSGFSDRPTAETLDFCFDNKKRRGTEEVRDVKMDKKQGKCWKRYADPKSAEEVYRHSHVADGHKLCVHMHNEPLRVENGQLNYHCRFLGVREEQTKIVKAQTLTDNPIVTNRDFTKGEAIDFQHAYVLINNYNGVHEEEHTSTEHAIIEAQVAMEKFQNPEPVKIQSIDQRKLEFLMKLPTEKALFENALLSNYARVKWPEINGINCTIDIISTLSEHIVDCRRLSKTWATTVRKQIESFFESLCVNELAISQEIWNDVIKHLPVDEEVAIIKDYKKLQKVFIVGHKFSANNMTRRIEDIIQKFETSHCIKKDDTKDFQKTVSVYCGAFSDQFIQYLSILEVSNFVKKQFEKEKVFGIWEFHEGNVIMMYSLSEDKAMVAVDILKTSVFNKQINISRKNYDALESHRWLEELKAIQRSNQKAIIEVFTVHEISNKTVFIYSISSEAVNLVFHKIKSFLSKSDIHNPPCKMVEMFQKMQMDLRQNEWRTPTGRFIYTRVGDITCFDVDVIVNPVNKELQLRGGLSRIIRDKGGKTIEKEFYDFIKRQRTLQEGDVLYTTAGNLPCKWIVHAVSPVWKGGDHKFKNLYKCVRRSFQTAHQQKCTSIAIPALSAGISGFPANHSTKTIVKSIRDYMNEKGHDSSIQKVYLCDINKDTVGYFESALVKYFS